MRAIKFRAWVEREKRMSNVKYMSLVNVIPGIMQYTGLKDRDGKEIYEGDILSQYYCDMLPQHFGEELKFDQGNHIGEVIYAKDCFRINDTTNQHLHKIFKDCTIIGNIYEDKGLL